MKTSVLLLTCCLLMTFSMTSAVYIYRLGEKKLTARDLQERLAEEELTARSSKPAAASVVKVDAKTGEAIKHELKNVLKKTEIILDKAIKKADDAEKKI